MLRGRLQVTYTPEDGGRPRSLDCTGPLSLLLDRLLVFLSDLMRAGRGRPRSKKAPARRS